MTRSARGLGLPDPDTDEVRHAASAVIEANPMTLGRLRITYTGGLSRSDPTAAMPGPPSSSLSERPSAARHHRGDHRPVDT
ncbi:hypothetical protein NKH18_08130 [Streptomyces sp. M10(2022)]